MAKKSERNIALGLEVKRLREELGITQKLLAERTKVDPAYISMIESGTRAFRMSGKNNFARDLSEVLGVHLSHWAKYTSDGQIAGIANVPLQQLEKLQLKF